MKFGKYLLQRRREVWADKYIDYTYLKKLIKQLKLQLNEQILHQTQGSELQSDSARSGDASDKVHLAEKLALEKQKLQEKKPREGLTSSRSLAEVPEHFVVGETIEEAGVPPEIKEFYSILHLQLDVINDHFVEQQQAIHLRWDWLKPKATSLKRTFEEHIKKLKVSRPTDLSTKDPYRLVQRLIQILFGDMECLKEYCDLNFQGYRKIIKKLAKQTGTPFDESAFNRVKEQQWVKHDQFSNDMSETKAMYAKIFNENKIGAATDELTESYYGPTLFQAIKDFMKPNVDPQCVQAWGSLY